MNLMEKSNRGLTQGPSGQAGSEPGFRGEPMCVRRAAALSGISQGQSFSSTAQGQMARAELRILGG